MQDTSPQTLAYKTRANEIECQYDVHAVIINDKKEIVKAIGDPFLKIFPRSSVKPVQAVAFAESGAIEKFALTNEEIALSEC